MLLKNKVIGSLPVYYLVLSFCSSAILFNDLLQFYLYQIYLFFFLVNLILLIYLVTLLGVDVKKNVVVTISSDKGLCGGINSTSVKISKGIYKLNSGISPKELIFSIFLNLPPPLVGAFWVLLMS